MRRGRASCRGLCSTPCAISRIPSRLEESCLDGTRPLPVALEAPRIVTSLHSSGASRPDRYGQPYITASFGLNLQITRTLTDTDWKK